jgi:hypothetical protein
MYKRRRAYKLPRFSLCDSLSIAYVKLPLIDFDQLMISSKAAGESAKEAKEMAPR